MSLLFDYNSRALEIGWRREPSPHVWRGMPAPHDLRRFIIVGNAAALANHYIALVIARTKTSLVADRTVIALRWA